MSSVSPNKPGFFVLLRRLIIATCSLLALPALADDAALQKSWKNGPTDDFLYSYCYDCHGDGVRKGGLELDHFRDLDHMRKHRDVWKKVRQQIDQGVMPPSDEDQPDQKEREAMIAWIDAAIFPIDPDNPDPGKIVLRRLNQEEYRQTIHDLLGVNLDVSNVMPPDDSGYGFDNIADVLSLAPSHLQKFHTLARRGLARCEKRQKREDEDEHRERLARIFPPKSKAIDDASHAQRCIETFANRAFRRPIAADEAQRYLSLYQGAREHGEDHREGIKLAYEAILISPNFLFRELPLLDEQDGSGTVALVPEIVLASRISYFLSSGPPDDRLLELASTGQLRKNLTREIDRLLQTEKVQENLVENFFAQWLQTRDVRLTSLGRKYRRFNGMRWAAENETNALFAHIIEENRPVDELLTARYTFVNKRLAKHYGMPTEGLKDKGLTKVDLPADSPRRGILTHASVLNITSNPTRTSPVKRGHWVLENILGTPPPPAPPNVPALDSDKNKNAASLTVRQRLELHRESASCASCHKLMDGIGFAMEHFDPVGRWRDTYDKAAEIDARGELGTGESFIGAGELIEVLISTQMDKFHHCVAEKMLTYGLGRGLDYYDKPALDTIVATADDQQHTFRAYVHATIDSVPFQYFKK